MFVRVAGSVHFYRCRLTTVEMENISFQFLVPQTLKYKHYASINKCNNYLSQEDVNFMTFFVCLFAASCKYHWLNIHVKSSKEGSWSNLYLFKW